MSFSGSTVISCYLQQNKLYCANVGDSRAILGRHKKSSIWETIALSIDHKPNLEKEAERIRKMKGRVEAYKDEYGEAIGPLRVWVLHDNVPGLAMTRSFGDLVGASVGVSPIPEIKCTDINQIRDKSERGGQNHSNRVGRSVLVFIERGNSRSDGALLLEQADPAGFGHASEHGSPKLEQEFIDN